MHQATKQKMVHWLSRYPDSTHPLDTQRFYDFVREACHSGDKINSSDLITVLKEVQPKWDEDYINQFSEEKEVLIECLINFYQFCIDDIEAEDEVVGDMYFSRDFQDFINNIGDLNYHEVYDLAQALSGNTDVLNFFEVSDESEDLIKIFYPVNNVCIIMKKEDCKQSLQWLEDTYMSGMDAESWYGFQYAMERHKND